MSGPRAAVVPDEVIEARVYLNRVAEPASVPVWGLVRELGPVEAAARIRAQQVLEPVLAATAARHASIDVHADLEAAQRRGIRLVVPESADWPHFALAALERTGLARLRDFAADPRKWILQGEPVPPLALWVQGPGELSGLATRSAGIVGARSATDYGEHVARRLARGLAERDVAIVSGGAYGIDAAAHRGALDALGDTVLVSAGGLDRAYPSGNDRLFRQVAETGLLVAESPPGSAPHRRRFLTRNRLVAAFSTGTVVVEASQRSGALNTVGHCSRIGRPIMAVPGSVESAMSDGCHHVLREPAWSATLVRSVADVLEVIGAGGSAPVSSRGGDGSGTRDGTGEDDGADADRGGGARGSDGPSGPPHGVTRSSGRGRRVSRTTRVLDSLDVTARSVFDGFPSGRSAQTDELVLASGMTISEVLRSLPVLELAGLIESADGGFRIRS